MNEKNQGELVVKPPYTFDRLMARHKQEKTESKNQPLKKRESTLPKREDDKVK
jgi:hypothetical protein